EVLAGWKDLTRAGGGVELAGVTLDGGEFPRELCADVDHEGRFEGIFAIRQRVEDFGRPVRGSDRSVLAQSRQETGMSADFRRDTVVRVPADRKRQDHHPRGKITNRLDQNAPG